MERECLCVSGAACVYWELKQVLLPCVPLCLRGEGICSSSGCGQGILPSLPGNLAM